MAANEHKNLSDINRHNPKGFEVATNDTVLSKGLGTSSTGTDGSLIWQKKSFMGTTNYKIQGYTTSSLTNYAYGEDIQDTRSPFQMDVDFGSPDVNLGTITPSNFFRIGQGFCIPVASTITSINGWITNNQGTDATIALCKITPVEGVTTAITPTAIKEVSVTGQSNNNKGVIINTTTITTPSLSVGDILFPMIKSSVAGSVIHFTLTIQTTTY